MSNSPTPALRPQFDHRSLLAEVARHDNQTPQLQQLCDSVNAFRHEAQHNYQLQPAALAHFDDLRFAETFEQSSLGSDLHQSFSTAMTMQLKPGHKKEDLDEQEQHYIDNVASLNVAAMAMLSNANQLTAQTAGALFRNTSLVVDKLMNTMNVAAQNNLNNRLRLQPANNYQDPNSPMALLAAMQSGNGSLLVNINADSAAATSTEMNNEAAEEQQHEFLELTQEQQVENDQAANLNMAAELSAELTLATTAEHEITAKTAPEPKPGSGKKQDDEKQQEAQQLATTNESSNSTDATNGHHLKDAIEPLEKMTKHAVVEKVVTHLLKA